MFLTEAKLNMTKELEAGQPTKYTKEELDEFEKVLKDFARTRLPGFACPEWVRVVEDLPVSACNADIFNA